MAADRIDDPGREGGSPASYEADLRRRANKRVKAREEFRQHVSAYVIVNAMLVGIWAVTSRGYFWPVWPMLGWGVGVAFHAISLRSIDPGPTIHRIDAEMERLRELDRRRGQGPALPPANPHPPFSAPADPPTWPTPPAGPDPQDHR